MRTFPTVKPNRRRALQHVISIGLAGLLEVKGGSMASAETAVSIDPNDVIYISGKDAPIKNIAEWEDPTDPDGASLTSENEMAFMRAPAEASVYSAKTFNFPSGVLRVLTFKQGRPVYHRVNGDTEIFVLSGSAELMPRRGRDGNSVKVSAGDALFMPSGQIINPNPSHDLVLVTALVKSTARDPKPAIVTEKEALATVSRYWKDGAREFTATIPNDVETAPKTATYLSLKIYNFDGNSIRVANYKKGGRSKLTTYGRTDVLIYVVTGRIRRKVGDQVLDLVAGDATRQKLGDSGYWEPLQDTLYIATDAPAGDGTGSSR
jgi:mannose-6-phosphate isomerase-like protein (cupin superfamily)